MGGGEGGGEGEERVLPEKKMWCLIMFYKYGIYFFYNIPAVVRRAKKKKV